MRCVPSRDSLGADAVILATRRTANGVEITAAMDFDADNVQDSTAPLKIASLAVSPVTASKPLASEAFIPVMKAVPPAPPLPSITPAAPVLAIAPEPLPLPPAAPIITPELQTPFPPVFTETPIASSISSAVAAAWSAPVAAETPTGTYLVPTLDPANDVMTSELKTLRRMLETQLAQLAWKDLTRRAPLHIEMLRELTEIGIEQGLAAEIVSGLPMKCEANAARRHLGATLSQRLAVTGDQWLEHGARIALVGPTGVGKTTALAKLAVRWVLRHGSRDLALIAGDSVRIRRAGPGALAGTGCWACRCLRWTAWSSCRACWHAWIASAWSWLIRREPGSAMPAWRIGSRCWPGPAGELQSTLVMGREVPRPAHSRKSCAAFAPAHPTSCVLTKSG